MEYAPAQIQAQLMGLSAEEACQLCWFGGLSEKLTSFGIYEFCPAYDERQKTASLIATMIWYFVEGYYDRVKLKDFDSNAFMKYLVSALDNSNHINMVFYKHKVTQKWWMEVPYPSELSSAQESIIIPCSYKDYQTANKGEVPDRWISIYAKLV
jgi:formiminoglutamase